MGKKVADRGIFLSRLERKGTVSGGLCEKNMGLLVFKKEEYRTCLYDDENDLVKRQKVM